MDYLTKMLEYYNSYISVYQTAHKQLQQMAYNTNAKIAAGCQAHFDG